MPIALYEPDRTTHEATGHVRFFCSRACVPPPDPDFPDVGDDTADAPSGTICETCGKEV